MISIIIPTKARLDLLKPCTERVKKYCAGEIIVVETGGDCDSTDYARREGCKAVNREGSTFAQACNAGVGFSHNRWVMLLNNDAVLTSEPPNIVEFPHASVIGTRLIYPNGLVQHAGIGFDLGYNPYNLWHYASKAHPEVLKRKYPRAVTFAYALIDRAAWDDLGGLDEQFINAYEDIDFCLRALENGYRVAYDPSAVAIHLGGQTEGRNDHVDESWHHFHEKWIATGRISELLGVWPISRG